MYTRTSLLPMNMQNRVVQTIIHHFKSDLLFRNSIYIMSSTFVLAAFGFLFWMLVARIAKPEDIGIATTLISVMSLIGGFSTLSLNISLIRYLPNSHIRNEMINSTFVVTGIVACIACIIFIQGIRTFSPHLLFLKTNYFYSILFVIFIIAYTWSLIIDGIFMAYRAAENVLFKNTTLSIIKLVLPFFLIIFGAFGIFTSVAVATVFGSFFAIVILAIKFKYSFRITFNKTAVSQMARFSIANYVAGFLYQLPILILPLLIVNFLNAKAAAYYYIDAMILNLLLIIPVAVTQSLLAEGSYDNRELQTHLTKSIGLIFGLLIPAVFVIYFFGNIVLHFFGQNYETEAFELLRLFGVSSFFASIALVTSAVFRIRHKIGLLLICNVIGCSLLLGSSVIFISRGLTGIGIGWLFAQLLTAALFFLFLIKEIGFNQLARKYFSYFKEKAYI